MPPNMFTLCGKYYSKKSDDFIIASGKYYSIKFFVNAVCKEFKIPYRWKGRGINEYCINKNNNKIFIKIDKKLYRPLDVKPIKGNAKKAFKILKWKSNTNFKTLIKILCKEVVNEKILILKNDRVGDFFNSVKGINSIINSHKNYQITIFLSNYSNELSFLFDLKNIKVETLKYNLSLKINFLYQKKFFFERYEKYIFYLLKIFIFIYL